MPRLRYVKARDFDRVKLVDTGGEDGRVGTVVDADDRDGTVVVDIDAIGHPWTPGFTGRYLQAQVRVLPAATTEGPRTA